MSNHKFPKRANVLFPEGKEYVIVGCLHAECKGKLKVYKNGRTAYVNALGKITSQNDIPCIRGETKSEIAYYNPAARQPDPLRTPDKEIKKVRINGDDRITVELEARLRETIVIIKVMYEDMMANDLKTKGTQMARNTLESSGYKELIKHLDNKAL